MPDTVPCTWAAPARTAETVADAAIPISLWQWMPTVFPGWACTTAPVTMPITSGSIPPLVSQSTTAEAPASKASSATRMAYSGESAQPLKKCSASKTTSLPASRSTRMLSRMRRRFSSAVVPSTSVT